MMQHWIKFGLSLMLIGMLSACSTVEKVQYVALEKVGIHKRDILVDRIEETVTAQEATKKQFKSAYHELASLVEFQDKDIAAQYARIEEAYENSQDSADALKDHIDSVDRVAKALFKEWQLELKQYTNRNLRDKSAKTLTSTKARYAKLHKTMQNSYKSIEPVLSVLRDNSLYLKHNLNASAITSLKTEVQSIEGKVQVLIKEMEAAIVESQQFIDKMKSST